MKKSKITIFVAILALLVLFLVACERSALSDYERFSVEKVYTNTFGPTLYLIVDEKTNVNYLLASTGYGASLTVMYDGYSNILRAKE